MQKKFLGSSSRVRLMKGTGKTPEFLSYNNFRK
jgi:hypothetical protein